MGDRQRLSTPLIRGVKPFRRLQQPLPTPHSLGSSAMVPSFAQAWGLGRRLVVMVQSNEAAAGALGVSGLEAWRLAAGDGLHEVQPLAGDLSPRRYFRIVF